MAAMLDKYNCYVYGKCPLTQCEAMNQAVLPIGTSDMLRQSAAKVYCPHCREIYFPKSSKLECLDGAYFGTTFAHLFFLTYQQLVPPTMPQPHCPRIYGFKIHKSVKENLRRQNERAQKQLPGQFFVTGPTAVFGKDEMMQLPSGSGKPAGSTEIVVD
ncbi:CKB1 [Symbiodinium microadriaticum]|nr:CKB1 [Symbiodinium microadriaticum]CAE7938495.1 CKB1 [Symbiodinium sp. KB8]